MMVDQFDATNSVRLCDRCEAEQGVSAGADAGDRACAACGSHDAPHVYPVAEHAEKLAEALREIAGNDVDSLTGEPQMPSGDYCVLRARRALAEWEDGTDG